MKKPGPMSAPTGAENWEHKIDEHGDQWLALVPNVVENVLRVYEKEPGQWHVVAPAVDRFPETDLALDHAAPLPVGPFASGTEAMLAVDAWCRRWAPRVVDLPGVYALRICDDGKIRLSSNRTDAGNADFETALPLQQARTLAQVLTVAVQEASDLPAADCAR